MIAIAWQTSVVISTPLFEWWPGELGRGFWGFFLLRTSNRLSGRLPSLANMTSLQVLSSAMTRFSGPPLARQAPVGPFVGRPGVRGEDLQGVQPPKLAHF